MTSSSPVLRRHVRRTTDTSIDIPEEIIEDILSKSPVKSVVRFKSVSKSWQSIISDPRISRTHRMQRSKQPENQNKFLIWSKYHPQNTEMSSCYTVYLIGFEDGKLKRESEVELPYESRRFAYPLCYCDGLFLLSNELNVYHYTRSNNCIELSSTLWNPSIRKHTRIRPLIPKNADFYPWRLHLYFDSVSADYKVVFVFPKCYTVYSCNNGSCGEMKAFPCDLHSRIAGDLLDGYYYTMQHVGDQMLVLSGRLCLFGFNEDGISRKTYQLWVMERNGSFDNWCFSWRKLFTMEKPAKARIWSPHPLWFSNEGYIFFRVVEELGSDSIYVYDPLENSFQSVEFDWSYCSKFYPYSENLYMPSSSNMQV